MMSRTHIAAGVAASLAILAPTTAAGCVAAVAGGAVGSIVCDVDTRPNDLTRDVRDGRLIASVLAGALLAADYLGGYGICAYVVEHLGAAFAVGAAGFAATCLLASRTSHRTFAHSLAALALFCVALSMACPPLRDPFAIGFASHVALDLLNKQPVQVLWPLKRSAFCLGVCRADGTANTVIMVLSTIAAAGLLAWRVALIAGI